MKKFSSIIVIFVVICIVLFAQDAMMIDNSGNVGIGTTGVLTEKLEVDGRIRAKVPIMPSTGSEIEEIRDILNALGAV